MVKNFQNPVEPYTNDNYDHRVIKSWLDQPTKLHVIMLMQNSIETTDDTDPY